VAFFWTKYMHFFQFNIGDYQSHTKHLTPMEDICYRRLLDWYYLHEQPIPNDILKISKLLLLPKYNKEIESILAEFFELTNDGWVNHRADKEILKFQGFSEAGKRGAAKRWSKGGDSPPIAPSTGGVTYPNAKQETINNKHKTRISDNFQVSDYVKDWAIKNRYDLRMVEKHKNYFIAACKSSSYEKESWDDFFIKAMMDNWAGFSNPKGGVVL